MTVTDKISHLIQRSLKTLGVPDGMVAINLDHPADSKFGDYSTNVAMSLIRHMGAVAKKPQDLAEILAKHMREEISGLKEFPVYKIEVAAPGFINFYLTDAFFLEANQEILEKTIWYGKNTKLWNQQIIIEHTNLNPFKPFHIGHLVNNAIGESLTRLLEFQDAKLTRASYGGDVGMHVAKTVWGLLNNGETLPKHASVNEQVSFIGTAYAFGSAQFDDNSSANKDIVEINKKIYSREDDQINALYDWGKSVSLEYFKTIYARLNSRFDAAFLESEVAQEGVEIVKEGMVRGIFKESEGAIIFPGEEYGLHNRVFINSQGLPTYEAKELGLTKKKFEIADFDQSIVVTANEQNDYFKVLIAAITKLYPDLEGRIRHIGHGMMRFASGKMSSRKGNIVTGEALLADVHNMVLQKMSSEEFTESEREEISEQVAVSAIKYSILKQTLGKDIIFDPEKSISFEGDSGPYLQYAYVRTRSLLAKAKAASIKPDLLARNDQPLKPIEKMLYLFPEIVERAANDYAPNYIATYLIQVAGEFNAYYAATKIIDQKDPQSAYRLALTEAVGWVLKNGLWLLGIQTPEKM